MLAACATPAGSLWGGSARLWGGVRAECCGGWLANCWVDGVAWGRDCGGVGFGWSEPQLELPTPMDVIRELAQVPNLKAVVTHARPNDEYTVCDNEACCRRMYVGGQPDRACRDQQHLWRLMRILLMRM
jgi:hypothetical protein